MPGRRRRAGRRIAPSSLVPRGFMEPCLLLLLRMRARHGYDLVHALAGFGMVSVDASIVYRLLRSMEASGLIVSQWEQGVSGPARRVYQVTPLGKDRLASWASQLREADQGLHHFFDLYAQHADRGGNEAG